MVVYCTELITALILLYSIKYCTYTAVRNTALICSFSSSLLQLHFYIGLPCVFWIFIFCGRSWLLFVLLSSGVPRRILNYYFLWAGCCLCYFPVEYQGVFATQSAVTAANSHKYSTVSIEKIARTKLILHGYYGRELTVARDVSNKISTVSQNLATSPNWRTLCNWQILPHVPSHVVYNGLVWHVPDDYKLTIIASNRSFKHMTCNDQY